MKLGLSILKAFGGTLKEALDSKKATAAGGGVGIIASTGDWQQDAAVAAVVIAYTLVQGYLDSRKPPPASTAP